MVNTPDDQSWKVLVVDDDEDDYVLVSQMLSGAKRHKFILHWAKSYADARSALLSEAYHAVLTDYDLGKETGIRLIREMTDRYYPGAFILYTGRGSDEVDLEAMQAGASMYLIKGETSAFMLERGIRYAIERKQYEQALAAQRAQLEAIFEAQQDVVLLYDPDGRVRRVNKTFQETYGFDPVGLPVREVARRVDCQAIDGQPLYWDRQPTAQALQGKKVTGAGFRVRTADGRERVVETSSSPLWLDNQITGSVTVWHDITDLQHMRQSLQEANQTLQDQAEELELQTEELRQQTEELANYVVQLHMSEERFHLALKNMPVTVANIDRQLCYTWVYNTQGGYKPEDLLGKPVGISTDPEQTKQIHHTLREVINQGISAQWETASNTHMGQRYFVAYAEPLHDRGGEINGAAMVSIDITDRKKAEQALAAAQARAIQDIAELKRVEEALRANEATLRGFLDATQESIWLFDPDGTILMGNRTALSRLNRPAEQVIGHPFSEFMPLNVAQARQAHIDEVIATGQPVEFEDQRAGICFLHNFYPVFDENRRAIRIAVFSRDITERKLKERELSRVNRILLASNKSGKAMLHAVDEVSYLQDVCQIITEDCGYAMVWIGYAEQDAAQSVRVVAYAGFEAGYLETLKLTWADCERGRGPTGTAIRTGQPSICRDMLHDPAFTPWREEALKRGYAASIVLPLKHEGNTFGALTLYSREVDPFTESEIELLSAIASDLSYGISILRLRKAQAQAEMDLRNYAYRLERSNKELENFAFVASHDLQEPLRKIEAFGQRIVEKVGPNLGETEREYLDRMQNAADRMRKMIEGLLMLSRVTTQGQPFTRVDLQQVFQAVMDDLQMRIQQSGGRVEVGTLPVITADPVQMHQLFLNLIGNALKFHQPNIPPVVSVTSRRNSNQQVEIMVKDNGIGFDPAQAERIFQPFVRLHARSEFEGSGIGLSICQKIVERHGGTLTANSQQAEGSQFIITLPSLG